MLAMFILPSAQPPLLLKPAAASVSKGHHPSIPTDVKLVPDANGVVMYNYRGRTGKVYNPKVVAENGLRYYYDFQYAGVQGAKQHFLNSADWLVGNATAKEGGKYCIWEYSFQWMFYGGIASPYASALAQAEGAELLAKAYSVSSEEKYQQAAHRAAGAFLVDYDKGGVVSGEDRGGDSLFLHLIAKPGFKKVYVLNGHKGAMLHLWEYFKITDDKVAKDVFDKGMRYLESHLPEFDAGDWSYYDKVGTKAMESYHRGQIKQLGYLYEITKEPLLEEYGHKFLIYYHEKHSQSAELRGIRKEPDRADLIDGQPPITTAQSGRSCLR